jgi:hypothetical protein
MYQHCRFFYKNAGIFAREGDFVIRHGRAEKQKARSVRTERAFLNN